MAPKRDKTSDGWVGDAAHQQETSDHNWDETGSVPVHDADTVNEVHAIDVDKDLNRAGVSMEDCVQVIVGRHRDGRDDRLQYVIYRSRIWSRSWGWTQRDYTGTNPHDQHAHFSSRYTTAQESDTSPWGLIEEFGMALDDTDKAWLLANLGRATINSAGGTIGGSLTALTNTDVAVNPIAKLQIPDFNQPEATRRKLALSTWIGYTDSNRNADRAALLAGVGALLAADDDVAGIDWDVFAEKLAGPLAAKLNDTGTAMDHAVIVAALREVFADAGTPPVT